MASATALQQTWLDLRCVASEANDSWRIWWLRSGYRRVESPHGCSLHEAVTGQAMVGPPRGARAPMNDQLPDQDFSSEDLSKSQPLIERALTALQQFLHVEAISGVILLVAAAAALLWANSPFAHSYHDF